jgi:hypothetical protein
MWQEVAFVVLLWVAGVGLLLLVTGTSNDDQDHEQQLNESKNNVPPG